MKKYTFLLLFICFTSILNEVNAQGMKFFQGTFEELKAEAKKQNKHIFLDFYTKWCGPCKMMVKKVFPLAEVGAFYNEHFICCKIDAEIGEGIELAKKYKVKFYPTFKYLDNTGKEIYTGGSIKGGDPKSFIRMGKTALGMKTVSFDWYQQEYQNGKRTSQFLLDYKRMSNIENRKLPKNFKWELFQSFSDKEKKGERGQRYVIGNASVGNRFYKYWVENTSQITILKNRIDYILKFNNLLFGIDNKEEYSRVCKTLLKDFPGYAPIAIEYNKIDKLRFEEDVHPYLKQIYEFVRKYKISDNRIITSIEEAVMEVDTPKTKYVKITIKGAKENVNKEPENFSYKATYAYLLYLSGEKEEAKTFAQKHSKETAEYQHSKKLKWEYKTMMDIARGKSPKKMEY